MTAALFQTVLFDTQTAMRSIEEYEYARFASSLWWSDVARVIQGDSSREIINWLLSTAMIRDSGIAGGNYTSSELVQVTAEYEPRHAGDRLTLHRDQFVDSQGKMAKDLGSKWAADIAAYMAYWPQKQTVGMLKEGTTRIGYDAKAFFATDHPLNPKKVSVGTYSNLITDDDYTITADKSPAANLDALRRVAQHVRTIKMPNGVDPRFLRVSKIIAGPAVAPFAMQATEAKYLAQFAGAGTGAGSADVTAIHAALGYGQVIQADEFTGNEYDLGAYFVVCEQAASSQLGGVVYVDREPFRINYYSESQIPELMHRNEIEWLCDGRNVMGPGHPYLIFKIQPES